MSALFLPPLFAGSFVNEHIEMEEALFIEQREQRFQQKKPTPEPDVLPSYLPYMFIAMLTSSPLCFLLTNSVPLFLLSLKVMLTIFSVFIAIYLITPNPHLTKKAPNLLKAQKLLFKGAVAATLITHFVYAISMPSPINIATALVMLTKSLGETYIHKTTVKYAKQFPSEKQLAVFSKIRKQQMDETNPDSIKYILCFSVLKLILSIAATVLYVFAPTETNLIKKILVSIFSVAAGASSLSHTVTVTGTVKAFIQERQKTIEIS